MACLVKAGDWADSRPAAGLDRPYNLRLAA